MIPYEELERALARWKARRTGTVELSESPAVDSEGQQLTPAAGVVLSGAVEVASSMVESRESADELDPTVDEADEAS
jgi:hypothetical protein